ncbi:hypothetical protein HPT27_03640 [Permianibacter sp. IMCC34836]|uniref:hypothetical protein n=1 Tax=Permianibacter fluminis TaxID=2738515 RepID=UPI001551852D|nr:hypothetical protein [Permianibacter fluminis]NQD36103.1 hypothetical protein [Permianibacter fluminis]
MILARRQLDSEGSVECSGRSVAVEWQEPRWATAVAGPVANAAAPLCWAPADNGDDGGGSDDGST